MNFTSRDVILTFFDVVLGIPHPAVDTRDVALYQVRNSKFVVDTRIYKFSFSHLFSPSAMRCVRLTRSLAFKLLRGSSCRGVVKKG